MDFVLRLIKIGLVVELLRYLVALFVFLIFIIILFGNPSGSAASTKTNKVLTYQQLVDYPVDCKLKNQQLVELEHLQKIKNFAEDPDDLNTEDRKYNARLKATIWWYAYGCQE
jgi:hypothetical protein